MKRRTPNLSWLRTFEAAARLLNFTAAGKELGLTQTAVSLHIKSLEGTLGCQLFTRRARLLSLTAMGQAYYETVRDSLAGLDLATSSLFGFAEQRTVTVRAPISSVALWIAPQIPKFVGQFPDVHIRLISTIWASSIADEDVDIDLRQGKGTWQGVTSERISTETIVPILQVSGGTGDSEEACISRMPRILILGYEDMWDSYFDSQTPRPSPAPALLTVDTTAAAISIVAAGAGVAVVQTRFAQTAVNAGLPIRIAGRETAFSQAHYIVRHRGSAPQTPEVALVEDWLRAIFTDRRTGV